MVNYDIIVPDNYVEREIEHTITSYLNDREIIIIRGPRQSGKTTLLARIAAEIPKIKPLYSVAFFNFEDDLEKIKFEENPHAYIDFYIRENPHMVLIMDEIQNVKNGGKILKLIYDEYPAIKIIVSGSSTLDISSLGVYLVGRALFFDLFPFSFGEFLKAHDRQLFLEYQINRFSFSEPKPVNSLFKDKLNQFLKEYITFGGYPRVVLETSKEKKIFLLKNLFLTYLEKDVMKLYGKYRDKITVLLKYLSATAGSLLNYNELSNYTSFHFKELKNLMNILEETYIIQRISPYHHNIITELKKNPKVYFHDCGMRNTLLERFDFSDEEWGLLLENYVFTCLKQKPLNYWRTLAKAEVDFVIRDLQIPIEVKSRAKITRALQSFLDVYKPPFGLLLSWLESDIAVIHDTNVYKIPVCLL